MLAEPVRIRRGRSRSCDADETAHEFYAAAWRADVAPAIFFCSNEDDLEVLAHELKRPSAAPFFANREFRGVAGMIALPMSFRDATRSASTPTASGPVACASIRCSPDLRSALTRRDGKWLNRACRNGVRMTAI